jgi:hypothetical protein
MEQLKQRFIGKFFFLKDLDSNIIPKKLTVVLSSTVYSLTQINEWSARIKASNFSCEDKFRPGHLPHVLGKALSDFLDEFPSATAGVIAQHFSLSKPTIKEIFQQEFGLQRFS